MRSRGSVPAGITGMVLIGDAERPGSRRTAEQRDELRLYYPSKLLIARTDGPCADALRRHTVFRRSASNRRSAMGRSRYKIYESDAAHFLTCTVNGWIPVFAKPQLAGIVLDSLRFLQDQDRLTVYAYVIMENHVHLIAQASDLSKEIASFKSYTAREIVDSLKAEGPRALLQALTAPTKRTDRTYQVWQPGSHPQLIQGKEMLFQKIEYVHENPVKRGYVDEAVDWRYSSARNYAGEPGLLDVTLAP